MADTSQNPQQSSIGVTPEDKLRSKELIGFLKERLRLDSESRDILRDSINESRKVLRELERQNARIETINRSTINIRDLDKEVLKIQRDQNVSAQQLLDIQTKYGITEENIGSKKKEFNDNLIKRVDLEKEYNKLASDQVALGDALFDKNKDAYAIADNKAKALVKEYQLQDQLKTLQETSQSDIAELESQRQRRIQEQVDLQKNSAIELKSIEDKAHEAAMQYDQDLFDQLTEQYKQKKEEYDLSQQFYDNSIKNLTDQLAIERAGFKESESAINSKLADLKTVTQTQLDAESELYAQTKLRSTQVEDQLVTLKEQNAELLTGMSEGQLAYFQNLENQKVLGKQLELTKQKRDLEKEVSNNLGISGGFAKLLADKLGVGNEVYAAMTEKARTLAETDSKRKDLQQQLVEAQKSGSVEQQESIQKQLEGLGKEQGLLSKRFSVLKEGAKGAKNAFVNMMKDPVAFASAIAAGFMAAQAGLNALGNAAKSAGNFMAGLSEHSANITRNLVSPITGLISNIPLVGGLIAGVVDGMAAFLDLLLGVDDHVVKLGRSIGLGADAARDLNNRFIQTSAVAKENNRLNNITSMQLLESYTQLGKNLGINKGISTEMAQQNYMLQKRLGLTEQEAAELTKIGIINKNDAEAQTKGIYANTQAYAKLTGVSLNYKEIVKSVTSLSGVLGLQFAKYPDKITKAVISTKLLGTELSKIDASASQFLDFESSISKEFEAQLLTGKNINLNKARQLALEGDTAGLAAEITRQLGDSESFLKMNRIQQEAIASAVGMSRDELGDMYKQQVLYSRLSVSDEESYKRKIRDLREQGIAASELSEKYGIAAGEFEKMFKQSTLEDFDDLLTKVKQALVDFAQSTGFVEKFQEFLNFLSKPEKIMPFIAALRDGFAKVLDLSIDIVKVILKGIRDLPFLSDETQNNLIDTIANLEAIQEKSVSTVKNLGKVQENVLQKEVTEGKAVNIDGKYFRKNAKGEFIIPVEVADQVKTEGDIQKKVQQSKEQQKYEAGDVGTAGYLARAGTGAAVGALFGPIGAAIGAGVGLIEAWVEDELNEAKKQKPKIQTTYNNSIQQTGFSNFGMSPGMYNLGKDIEKHASGGVFESRKDLYDPITKTTQTFGEAGPEVVSSPDKIGSYLMRPIDQIMRMAEDSMSDISERAANIVKSSNDALDQIIDLTASIISGKSKEDNYGKQQPVLQAVQASQDKNPMVIYLNSTVTTNDVAIGQSNERYAFQYAGSKIERVTGPLG